MHSIAAERKGLERTLCCLAEVAEQAAEAIAVFDLEGTVLFVNTAWAAVHGYDTAHQLIGRHISLFHTPEQMKTDVLPFIEQAERSGRLEGPLPRLRKDGSFLNTETKMSAVTDRTGQAVAIIAFTTDTTEQKQAQHELQTHCDRLERQIVELKTINDKLQQQMAKSEHTEEQLLESIIEADKSAEPIEPFNPQELKALSELAKRLI